MDLKIKTKLGTLLSRYRELGLREKEPGFETYIRRGDAYHRVCNICYIPEKDCIQVAVYNNGLIHRHDIKFDT